MTTAATTLLLVRHGETVDNVNHIMQGQTQGQLTRHGREQAATLGDQLAHYRIDAFVASDLRRAVDTCRTIAQRHGAAVVTTPLLRERDWGGFTGRYIPDLKDVPWPDDIESEAALKERAARFLAWVRRHYTGQTVLAVGHGIINKALQSVLLDKPMRDVPRMDNGEMRTLTI